MRFRFLGERKFYLEPDFSGFDGTRTHKYDEVVILDHFFSKPYSVFTAS